MTIYFSSRSGGPCWSKQLGYHTPKSWPPHIKRMIVQSKTDHSADKKQTLAIKRVKPNDR